MSDLKKYVEKRKASDPEFAENYESGYREFKIGVLLREARKEAGQPRDSVHQTPHHSSTRYREDTTGDSGQ